MEQRPSLKTGVRIWRSRFTGELRIGTAQRNLAFPTNFRGIDSEALLKVLDGRRRLESISALSGAPLEELKIFLAALGNEGLIDFNRSERLTDPSKTAPKRASQMGESIDSISLRARNEQLEADSITFRNGVVDGGLSAISRRAKFKILIFNTNRIAIHIAGALKAAGFEELIIIDRSPRNHRSRYVQGEDLNGGYFRKSEILHLKEPLIDELCSPGLSGERKKIDLPDLIIAAGSPNFDAQQRWMSEATPHFIVEYENSAEVRIGPLVIPGKTPCLECIEVSEVESGNNLPAREQFKEYELSSGLALQTAGLVTLAVCEFADTGSSQFLERTMALSGHDFLRPTMRTWLMHPSCGCAC